MGAEDDVRREEQVSSRQAPEGNVLAVQQVVGGALGAT